MLEHQLPVTGLVSGHRRHCRSWCLTGDKRGMLDGMELEKAHGFGRVIILSWILWRKKGYRMPGKMVEAMDHEVFNG